MFLSPSLARLRNAWPLILLCTLAACGPSGSPQGGGKPGGPGGAMPAPQVGVMTVAYSHAAPPIELPGRLEARRVAQVRARSDGVVTRRLFKEGSIVKTGQVLFEIDPAPYEAALEAARAQREKAKAVLAQAQAQEERNRPLMEAKAISQQEWLATQTALSTAQADLAATRAAVQQAHINLRYASVTAPISGHIGRANVTEGALVSQAEATLLATIQQVDKLYVNFTQSAAQAMRLKRATSDGQAPSNNAQQVRLLLDDGSEYAHPGRLLFTDLSVEPSTGQVNLRAEVPNPEGELMPGLFVRVRITPIETSKAIVLPQQAVTHGPAGDSVLVLGADKKPAPRIVTLGGSLAGAHGPQWLVLSGLQPGEQVIVDGFQKIRPQEPVQPVAWIPAASGAAGAAAGQAAQAAQSAPAPASAARSAASAGG